MFGVNAPGGGVTPLLTPELMQALIDMGVDPYEWIQGQASAPPLRAGLRAAGNVDLSNRPIVQNADGTTSTVRSMSFGTDAGEVLVPTVSDDGRILSDEEAMDEYYRSGRHLGIFNDPDAATLAGGQIHDEQEQYGREVNGRSVFPVEQSMDTPPQEERGFVGNVLGGLGSMLGDPGRESLMSFGLGVLGAQNTYGSALSALGQGGQDALQTYGYAKRRAQIDQAKQDQIEAAKEAAKSKRIDSILSQAERLQKSGQHELATKLVNDNADVLEYLNATRGEIIYQPEKKAPKLHVAERSGRVFAISDDGVRVVGQVDAEPLQGPDPYAGMSTEKIYNPETGQTEVVRVDRMGRKVATVGLAPPSRGGPVATFNPETGEFTMSMGGDEPIKTPTTIVNNAYAKMDAAGKAVALGDQLLDVINSKSVGFVPQLQQATLGTLSQLDAGLAAVVNAAIAEVSPELEAAGYKPAQMFNPDVSAVQVLGDLFAIQSHKTAEESTRGLTDYDAKTARARVGYDEWLTSADQVKHRVTLLRDQAAKDQEYYARRITDLTKKPPAGGVRRSAPQLDGGAPALQPGEVVVENPKTGEVGVVAESELSQMPPGWQRRP